MITDPISEPSLSGYIFDGDWQWNQVICIPQSPSTSLNYINAQFYMQTDSHSYEMYAINDQPMNEYLSTSYEQYLGASKEQFYVYFGIGNVSAKLWISCDLACNDDISFGTCFEAWIDSTFTIACVLLTVFVIFVAMVLFGGYYVGRRYKYPGILY